MISAMHPGCAAPSSERRAPLRAVGNNEVNYFITTAGHGSPETDSKLCAIMNDLPPMNPFDRGGK
jgi:hypothetical protein